MNLFKLSHALIASLSCCIPALADDPPAKKPNIVFIIADDLGYGDLGCYGQEKIRTPKLDRMASEGMRFTQCYAGSPVCAPSRCSLMTGLHTGHCLIRGNGQLALRVEDRTLAEALKEAGYATGFVGKWGLGGADSSGAPNKKGFDSSFGYLDQGHAHNYYPDFLWRNGEKVAIEGNEQSDKNNIAAKRTQYAPDLFTKDALEFIDKNKDRPFFLFYASTVPHANNEKTKADGNGMEVPDLGLYADRDWPAAEKAKAAMISRLDTDVGKILTKLRDLKLDENTIVFFTSDNGPHKEGGNDPNFFNSSGGLRGIKRDLYEGGIRVPMIVRWPKHIQAGSESDLLCAFWDVFPTVAALAGVSAPARLDGVSLVPTLIGKGEQTTHPYLYWEFHEGGSKQAVHFGNWKAVRLSPKGPIELYNLRADPSEQENVAAKHADIVEKASNMMQQARTESATWPLREPLQKPSR